MSDCLQPRGLSPPASSVHGVLQARYWCGQPFPFPGDLPNPGLDPLSSALQVDSLQPKPPGKPRDNGREAERPDQGDEIGSDENSGPMGSFRARTWHDGIGVWGRLFYSPAFLCRMSRERRLENQVGGY